MLYSTNDKSFVMQGSHSIAAIMHYNFECPLYQCEWRASWRALCKINLVFFTELRVE